MVFESSPPNVTFRRDTIGPRLVSWNASGCVHPKYRPGLVNFGGIYLVSSQLIPCTKH
jgi:hypothetical protein